MPLIGREMSGLHSSPMTRVMTITKRRWKPTPTPLIESESDREDVRGRNSGSNYNIKKIEKKDNRVHI